MPSWFLEVLDGHAQTKPKVSRRPLPDDTIRQSVSAATGYPTVATSLLTTPAAPANVSARREAYMIQHDPCRLHVSRRIRLHVREVPSLGVDDMLQGDKEPLLAAQGCRVTGGLQRRLLFAHVLPSSTTPLVVSRAADAASAYTRAVLYGYMADRYPPAIFERFAQGPPGSPGVGKARASRDLRSGRLCVLSYCALAGVGQVGWGRRRAGRQAQKSTRSDGDPGPCPHLTRPRVQSEARIAVRHTNMNLDLCDGKLENARK